MLKLKHHLLVLLSKPLSQLNILVQSTWLCNSNIIFIHFLVNPFTKKPKFTNPFCFLVNNHTQKLEKQKHNTHKKKPKSHTHFASYYDSFQVKNKQQCYSKKNRNKIRKITRKYKKWKMWRRRRRIYLCEDEKCEWLIWSLHYTQLSILIFIFYFFKISLKLLSFCFLVNFWWRFYHGSFVIYGHTLSMS